MVCKNKHFEKQKDVFTASSYTSIPVKFMESSSSKSEVISRTNTPTQRNQEKSKIEQSYFGV